MNYRQIEERLGYTFKDKKLLKTALTLASADPDDNNQTMEFFGDAILEFLVSEKIYDENSSEGKLTEKRKMYVSDEALTPVAEKLGLDKFLIRSPGDTNNIKSVPSSYEAVLAAIYLDGGLSEARSFVMRTMDFNIAVIEKDYKSRLQENYQKITQNTPKYDNENIGTPQSPEFVSRTVIFDKTFEGRGSNRKQAEQLAAKNALDYFSEMFSEKNKRN